MGLGFTFLFNRNYKQFNFEEFYMTANRAVC